MEKVWFKSYQTGVAHEINPDSHQSINEIFEASFKKFFDRPAFSNMGTTLKYSDIDKLSYQFAAFLQNDLGLNKSDRVAIMSPNILQYPVCLYGILRAGMTVVNVNPLYTERELEYQLRDSEAKAIVIVENFCHVLQKIISSTQVQHVITTEVGDLLKAPKSYIVNFAVKYIKKMVPPWDIANSISLKRALRDGGSKKIRPPDLKPEDLAFLQYTGGTTGISKGAMLTHRNIVANILQAREWIKATIKEGKESKSSGRGRDSVALRRQGLQGNNSQKCSAQRSPKPRAKHFAV